MVQHTDVIQTKLLCTKSKILLRTWIHHLGLGLMRWSLLPNALRPFKIYCAPAFIISQLVLFLWQTVEIDPLGHVRVVEALQKFFLEMRPRDIVRDSH